mgnify:CR=1 FL=1
MKYINILLSALCIILVSMIGSSNIGGIGSLWDGISLLVVLLPAFLLTAASCDSYNFFNDKQSVLVFGNLALGFGMVGTMIGIIFTFAGMAVPPPPGVDPVSIIIANLAIASITLLYGLLFKYFFALPLAHSIKEK